MSRFSGPSIGIFLLLVVLSCLVRPLAEPDEGRYAEAAREMLDSGDWLTPRQSGVSYPDKPPGAYWLMAAFMALLGPTSLAARLPACLAYVLLLWLLYRHERWRGPPGHAAAATWIVAASPLLFALGQLATLDMLLSLLITAGLLFGHRWLKEGAQRFAWLAGVALGAGFLVKGPVAWGLPLAILLVAGLLQGNSRQLLRLLSFRLWIPMLGIGLPWYFLASQADPELLDFWLNREVVGRVAGDVHGRGKPLWFFPALTVGITLPWLVGAVWARWRRDPEETENSDPHPDRIFHLVWGLLPVVFFSIPSGKQPAYLAPAIPGMALCLAHWWRRARLKQAGGILSLALLLLYVGAEWVMQVPENSRSDDPFAASLQDAGAENWKGGQLNGWSYGLSYRLERTDLSACCPNPKAWRFAETLGRVPVLHDAGDRLQCGLDILAGADPAFLFLPELDATPGLMEELVEAAEASGIKMWQWLRIEDRVLLANRAHPKGLHQLLSQEG